MNEDVPCMDCGFMYQPRYVDGGLCDRCSQRRFRNHGINQGLGGAVFEMVVDIKTGALDRYVSHNEDGTVTDFLVP